MLNNEKEKSGIDKKVIIEMRQSGVSMREIAEKVGRSKERVRQILIRRMGTTDHKLLSTLQLCYQSGLPRNRIIALYQEGVITPAKKWDAGQRDYLLWSPDTVQEIIQYYKTHRLCKICNKTLPKNRISYCSDECRREKHKYKYLSPDGKKRVLANIRRYRQKQKTQQDRELATV